MLLIHPPVAKPCEPPAGIARLLGALDRHGAKAKFIDVNIAGLLNLLPVPPIADDTWTQRAFRNRSLHLAALKDISTYQHFARYKRAVLDLNRVLQMETLPEKARLGMANYQDRHLLPTRSADLIQAAEKPEGNPFFPYFRKVFLEALEHSSSPLLGFSLNYLSQSLSTFAMMGFLKKECPAVRVVLGGGLVTSWAHRPKWGNPFRGLVDYVVEGPGESPLLSLLGVPEKEGKMDGLPLYDDFPLGDYLAPGTILPYSASSGCYWSRCRFCPERAEGNPYLPIPDDRVTSELQTLVKKNRPVLIHMLDNAIRPSLMEKIVQNPPGVPWYGFARITRHLADLDFCLALKRSGCVMLQLGLESGDQAVLDQLEKGVDLEIASQALRALKRAGIATYVYLLFGTPAETVEEARKTLAFVADRHDQIDYLNVAIFNLPLGGLEGQELATEEFSEGDLSLYTNFSHPRGWHRNLVRQFLDKEFKRHPAIAPILRRDPPIFTSNHAPFFCNFKLL